MKKLGDDGAGDQGALIAYRSAALKARAIRAGKGYRLGADVDAGVRAEQHER